MIRYPPVAQELVQRVVAKDCLQLPVRHPAVAMVIRQTAEKRLAPDLPENHKLVVPAVEHRIRPEPERQTQEEHPSLRYAPLSLSLPPPSDDQT